MKNYMKTMNLDQIKDQVMDLKSQLKELHFRKPWTRERGTGSARLLMIGAGLALAGFALYKNRQKVARLWKKSGVRDELKEKAERIMERVREQGKDSIDGIRVQTKQERTFPN